MPVLNILVGIVLAIPAVFIILYLIKSGLKHGPTEQKSDQPKDSAPLVESDYSKEAEKSYQLMQDAVKKAQELLGQAELDQIKIVADTRTDLKKFEDNIEKEIGSVEVDYKQNLQGQLSDFSSNLKKAEDEYTSYLGSLKLKSDQFHQDSLNVVKQEVNKLFINFEQNLSEFLSETEQKSTQTIELELQATRHLIDTYERQQMQLVDENIVAMLERTLSIVLPKKLSLDDQVDLVLEALEKAKAEKFIT